VEYAARIQYSLELTVNILWSVRITSIKEKIKAVDSCGM
jgi:hypothetical protein